MTARVTFPPRSFLDMEDDFRTAALLGHALDLALGHMESTGATDDDIEACLEISRLATAASKRLAADYRGYARTHTFGEPPARTGGGT